MLEEDTDPLDYKNFDLRQILDNIENLQNNVQNFETRINALEQNKNQNNNQNNDNIIQENRNISLLFIFLPIILIFLMENFSNFLPGSNTYVNKNLDDNALIQKLQNLQEQYKNLYQRIGVYSKEFDVAQKVVLTQQDNYNNMQIQVNNLKEELKNKAILKIDNFSEIQNKIQNDIQKLSKDTKNFDERISSVTQQILKEKTDTQNTFQVSLDKIQNEQKNMQTKIQKIEKADTQKSFQVSLDKIQIEYKNMQTKIQKIEKTDIQQYFKASLDKIQNEQKNMQSKIEKIEKADTQNSFQAFLNKIQNEQKNLESKIQKIENYPVIQYQKQQLQSEYSLNDLYEVKIIDVKTISSTEYFEVVFKIVSQEFFKLESTKKFSPEFSILIPNDWFGEHLKRQFDNSNFDNNHIKNHYGIILDTLITINHKIEKIILSEEGFEEYSAIVEIFDGQNNQFYSQKFKVAPSVSLSGFWKDYVKIYIRKSEIKNFFKQQN